MPEEIQVGYLEQFLLIRSSAAVAQLPREVVGSPSLEGFKNHRDVALRNVGSGHGGLGLDWMIIEVFSNLNDSMILWVFDLPTQELL